MNRCWERTTLARSRRLLAGLMLAGAALCAQPRQAALASLKAGAEALEKGDADSAARELAGLAGRLPQIADYASYLLGQAEAQRKNHAAAAHALEPVWRMAAPSPLAGRAAVLAARSLLELKQFRAALEILARVPDAQLPQPQADLLRAQAQEGAGDLAAAAGHFQRVYFYHAASREAAEAGDALERLAREMGGSYPAPAPAARLERARLLMEGGRAPEARAELERAIPALSGLERQQARVRIGAAWYHQRRSDAAVEWLSGLDVSEPEADAERLYYIAAANRRRDDDEAMLAATEELGRRYPLSPWRLKALVLSGNEFLIQNQPARFVALYKTCADNFPAAPEAAYCHWKVAWRAYLDRQAGAQALLREHLARFPASDKAGAAVYFLGRLAEEAGDAAFARRLYAELLTRFPNYYYAMLARGRMAGAAMQRAGASSPAEQWLASVRWPVRNQNPDFRPDAAAAQSISRARLLSEAGLERWAEIELRHTARNGGNRFPLSVELAETATRRGAPEVGLRHIKATVPDYLWVPREAAPRNFWKLAFPFPYRDLIVKYARERDLDPFFVAALIRQESEFDPNAVSAANAIGLMQVTPPSGRDLGRRLGIKGVRAASLRKPALNVNLGTFYLRKQLDARGGSVEETLAGYNAGPNRVPVWKGWGEYREPAEFVETIPFGETRDYVQIVLRNADLYRWLYANEPLPAAPAAKTAAPAAGKAAVKKNPTRGKTRAKSTK